MFRLVFLMLMSAYGKAAVMAAEACRENPVAGPRAAWEDAVQVCLETESTRKKGCPRSTFLGLCQAGLVKGVPAGEYTRSVKNGRYGEQAVALLREDARWADRGPDLWRAVMAGEEKKANSQMEVVIGLWRARLIVEG